MPARYQLVSILQTMKLAESVITKFKLHLQIHVSKIARRHLTVIVLKLNQQDEFSFVHEQLLV